MEFFCEDGRVLFAESDISPNKLRGEYLIFLHGGPGKFMNIPNMRSQLHIFAVIIGVQEDEDEIETREKCSR